MTLALVFTLGVSVRQWQKQGVLQREKQLYEAFLKKGVCNRVYWFTYGKDDLSCGPLVDPNIKIVPLPAVFNTSAGRFLYSLVLPFIHSRQFKEAEGIKSNQMKGSWAAWLAARVHRRKFILRAGYPWSVLVRQKYGRFYGRIVEAIECFLTRRADGVIVTTSQEQKRIVDHYRVPDKKVTVIPNYVDTNLFKPAHKACLKGRLVFVGRIHHDKNLENLVKALKGTRWGLDIYGDGPLKDHLKTVARENQIDLSFKGIVANDKLPQILQQYDYFILPSVYEGMPKALLEAMACGLLVMATNSGGVKEIIRDGVNGWLFPSGSIEHIKKILLKIGSDRSAEDSIKVEARNTIEKYYSLSEIANKEAGILK